MTTTSNQSLDDQLLDACEKGNLNQVKALVEQGADIHVNDDYPLRWAVVNGHLPTVQYLVEQGADIHTDDDYPLYWAVFYDYLEIVLYLVSQGASLDELTIGQVKELISPQLIKPTSEDAYEWALKYKNILEL